MNILNKNNNSKNAKKKSKKKLTKLEIEGQNKGKIIKPEENKRKKVFLNSFFLRCFILLIYNYIGTGIFQIIISMNSIIIFN
jgi:hypothetical protein